MLQHSGHYQRAPFVIGAHALSQLPRDEGIEIAFAGRSNAGKSSAINAITGHKALARTSKTPGRTQQINFFSLGDQRHLVDLPGYGFAKVSEFMRRHWRKTLEGYIGARHSLRGVVLMMDIRHPLTEFDTQMLDWCHHIGRPVHILLTKSDKLGRGAASATLQKVRRSLEQRYDAETAPSVQLFSAMTGAGVAEARALLDNWYGFSS